MSQPILKGKLDLSLCMAWTTMINYYICYNIVVIFMNIIYRKNNNDLTEKKSYRNILKIINYHDA